MPDYKYVRNKLENEFPTNQAEYSQSCECLGPSGVALDDDV